MPQIPRSCVKCGDEFILMPGKPGFANTCPACSAPAAVAPVSREVKKVVRRKTSLAASRRNLLRAFVDLAHAMDRLDRDK